MAITGRNLDLSALALLGRDLVKNGNDSDESTYITSPRQAFQVLEVGCTIAVNSGGAGDTIAAKSVWDCKVYDKNNQSGVKIASAEFAASSVAGDEKTSRDGSFAFEAAYQNASDRVFAKGARIVMVQSTKTSNTGDIFAPYVLGIPFGAPTA